MGGHEGGKEASALAVELFKKRFEHQTPLELEKWIEAGERFIRDVSECIRRTAMEKGHEVSGTTFTGAVVELLPVLEKRASIRQVVETGVQNGEAFVMIAHVGDSHAYIHRSAGSLELITTDDDCLSDIMHGKLDSNTDANTVHTQIRELQRALDGLEMAEKKRLLTESYNFTSDEIARYEKEGHTIIAALGVEVPDKPFVSFTHLLPGDTLILLSDGLDVLTHAEKEKILQEAIDAEMASQELILQATLKVKQKRVKDDDMTVAILENTYTEEH